MSSQKYSINQQLILRDRHSGNSAPSPMGYLHGAWPNGKPGSCFPLGYIIGAVDMLASVIATWREMARSPAWMTSNQHGLQLPPRGFGHLQPELFEVFLVERRRLMAQKIKQYYWGVRAYGRVIAARRRLQG
ncbi:hypothetical protein AQS70_09605 [Pseudomonas endophytica]|uniref:Uncharacterized protein n=1 Tax=Pseudomonas endophytica TaxID=1563157 RepID=A0A0Q0X990_9PSED|nr:hypothetical protein AQS70_09605 [Pseudomonas endophytica]